MMAAARRKQVYNTYGRHRKRVVVAEDVWVAEPKQSEKGLFSSFSSNSGDSALNDTSTSSFKPEPVKRPVRATRRNQKNKENIHAESSWLSQNDSNQNLMGSDGIFGAAESKQKRMLKDYDPNTPTTTRITRAKSLKKTANKNKAVPASTNTTKKRNARKCLDTDDDQSKLSKTKSRAVSDKKKTGATAKAVRRKKVIQDESLSSIETSRHDANSANNFSQFDNYSLVISDSPPADQKVIATPDIEVVDNRPSIYQIKSSLTSTPQIPKEKVQCNLWNKMMDNDPNLSHIEVDEICEPDTPDDSCMPKKQSLENRFGHMSISVLSSVVGTPDNCDKNHSDNERPEINGICQRVLRSGDCNGVSVRKQREFDLVSGAGLDESDVVYVLDSSLGDGHSSIRDFSNVTDRSYRNTSSLVEFNSMVLTNDNSVDNHSHYHTNSSQHLPIIKEENNEDKTDACKPHISPNLHAASCFNVSVSHERLNNFSHKSDVSVKSQGSHKSSRSNQTGTCYDASQSLFDSIHGNPEAPAFTSHRKLTTVSENGSDSGEERNQDSEEESEKSSSEQAESDCEASELSDIKEEPDDDDNVSIKNDQDSCEDEDHSEAESEDLSENSHNNQKDSVSDYSEHSDAEDEQSAPISSHEKHCETSDKNYSDEYHSQRSMGCESPCTPSEYHTCRSAVTEICTTPPEHMSQFREELQHSTHSLRLYLTPIKLRKSGLVVPPRDKVLTLCGQSQPVSFSECIPAVMMRKCKKIGEGVYGEVFRSERNREPVALKVIPIEGDLLVNDEQQKTFEEILPEIVISTELSSLHNEGIFMTENFVQVKRVSVVQGTYPSTLLKQWDAFHKRKGSENDRPDQFNDDQLFIIFEFNDCGSDLESMKFESVLEARSVLHQVACALAVAEAALQFEHRDLHWGNVLVKSTDQESVHFRLNEGDFYVKTHGYHVSIIDFTLSRMNKDGCNIFTDLSADPTIFEGQGDYQFDVYRLMKEENGYRTGRVARFLFQFCFSIKNTWSTHHPFTNVLWIHYISDKLLHAMEYQRSSGRDIQSVSRQFRTLVREATNYNSALHLLTECPFFEDCLDVSQS